MWKGCEKKDCNIPVPNKTTNQERRSGGFWLRDSTRRSRIGSGVVHFLTYKEKRCSVSQNPERNEIDRILRLCQVLLEEPMCGLPVLTFFSPQEMFEQLLMSDEKRISTHFLKTLFQGVRRFCIPEKDIRYDLLYVFHLPCGCHDGKEFLFMFGQEILLPECTQMCSDNVLEEERLFHLRVRSPLSLHCGTLDMWREYVIATKMLEVMNCVRMYSHHCRPFRECYELQENKVSMGSLTKMHTDRFLFFRGKQIRYRELFAPASVLDTVSANVVREQSILKELKTGVV